MFHIFNLDDDGLPKIRRSLMLFASLLVVSVWAGLKLDLTYGPLQSIDPVSISPKSIDPAVIFIPILFYLMIRAAFSAIWFIPFSKVEHLGNFSEVKQLAAQLEEYANEAKARTEDTTQVGRINITPVKDLLLTFNPMYREVSAMLDKTRHYEELIKDDFGSGNHRSVRISEHEAIDPGPELGQIYAKAESILKDCREIEAKLSQFTDLIGVTENQFSALENLKTEAERLDTAVRDKLPSKKLESIIHSFSSLNTDIMTAARRKVKIELWFNLILPLAWASFAIFLARENVLQIIDALPF